MGDKVVIGAASRVRYSVSVVACTAADALAAFKNGVKEANRMQKRLPSLMEEMEGLKVSIDRATHPLFSKPSSGFVNARRGVTKRGIDGSWALT